MDSLSHRHIGLIVSAKLCQNLSSFGWLKFNLKWVSNFKPLISWTAKTNFSLSPTEFRIFDLNVFIESMFSSSSLKSPHSLAKCGKKYGSKTLVLAQRIYIDFWVEDQVKHVLVLSYGVR